MSQPPSQPPSRIGVSTAELSRIGIRFPPVHPVVAAFSIALVLSAVRLLAYWLLARGFGGLSHGLCNYDCAWYERLARGGYDLAPHGDIYGNTANWAFFPLYPLLLAIASALTHTGQEMTWTGILISTASFAGFATLGALYLQNSEDGDARRAAGNLRIASEPVQISLTLLCLVSLWPGDIYFAFPYSEGLYALALTASLLALARREVMTSAVWSAALSATRPPGLLMTPVILADRLRYLMRCHRDGTLRAATTTVLSHSLLPIALAPLGLFAFMAYLRWHMGDGLAFVHVQSAWNRHAMLPLTALWDGITVNDWGRVLAHPARESLSLEAAFGIAGLILAVRQILAHRYAEAWLIGGSVLLAASSGLQSMPRFVLTNPVIILALVRLATAGATGRRLILIGLALTLLQGLFVLAWFMGAPVLA